MRFRQGFTLIESVTLVATLSVAGALGAAAIKLNGSQEKALQSQTQLRGIHQSFVTFAQSNKRGGQDGYFPGLDSAGHVVDASTRARFHLLLIDYFFTGDYIISPLEDLTSWQEGFEDEPAPLLAEQYSYAMLKVDSPSDAGRRAEWSETLNTSAVVVGDRNTGVPAEPRSVWSEGGEHQDWAGGMTRNDNSTTFETSPIVEQTRFGNHDLNETDHLFIADTPDGRDTLLTFSVDAQGQEVATPRRHHGG